MGPKGGPSPCYATGVSRPGPAAWARPRVYLDVNAGLPLCAAARTAMAELMAEAPANPSSIHAEGRAARARLERARRQVAGALAVDPLEVVWTSGGTESNVLAIHGALGDGPADVVVDPLSHPSVTETLRRLQARGRVRLHTLPVDDQGRLDPAGARALLAAVRPALVSVCVASHELGVVHDVAAVARAARAADPTVRVHADAVQALGKIPVDPRGWDADLVSLSAHKVGGPAGVGVLLVRRPMRLEPPWAGGEQERGHRPGTEPLWAAVPAAAAIADAVARQPAAARALAERHRHLLRRIATVDGVRPVGCIEPSTHNTVLLTCDGADGQILVMALDLEGFAVSTGAACSAGQARPVAALLATGHGEAAARQAVRVSFSHETDLADLDRFVETLRVVLPRVRRAVRQAPTAGAPAMEAS